MNRSEIKKIGGSDIAAILGLSKWKSAHSLYLHLVGELPPQPDNPAMERGRILEPVIARMFMASRRGEFDVIEPITGIIEDTEYPFLIGSPDRLLSIEDDDDKRGIYDDRTFTQISGLEIKTADVSQMPFWGEEDTDQIPQEYLLQTQWYAGLCGVPDWYIAVGFVMPNSKKIDRYREYKIAFDGELYEHMRQKAVEFWTEHVEKRIPPPITEADPETVRYFKQKYPSHTPGKFSYSDEAIDSLASEYLQLTADNKMREERADAMKLQLIAAIGENEGIVTAMGKFTYKQCKPSQKIDWEGAARSLGVSSETIANFTTERPGHRTFLPPKGKK